ncbi:MULTISPECIES: DUF6944 family repetitive protein [Pontibacillus]|uniref:Uncharacterized protein n=1 Tax=Pontibacillus chungwhensis TaxID=265426 RepID=A0ABY8V2P1_9BACI|nr:MULTISPECIES: hypothetical protein [Pontibacillus]MCD5324632.1 hypothetical protein [Pontibacillus sp. HN14]WIF99074.1 hypothetical protein QNI29_05305 [Pontibacillus chungwhensis]
MEKEVFGAWVVAIGTTLAALGNTPSLKLPSSLAKDLDVTGNVLQGTGSAILADTEESFTLNKLGNMIQATGNSTVVSGLLFPVQRETSLTLLIKGNLLQALGSGTSLADDLNEERVLLNLYAVYGDLLQMIGNSLQAIAEGQELKGRDAQTLETTGNWVQAIGSYFSLLATLPESP